MNAIAAATGTAKTPKAVEREASQSGPKGIAHNVRDSGSKPCREGNYNNCSQPRARND